MIVPLLFTDVAMPPDGKLVLLHLFVNGQVQGARCWIDDMFIRQYPK